MVHSDASSCVCAC